MYKIDFTNTTEQSRLQYKKIRRAVENALKGEKINEAEISIVFMNNDDIRDINKRYLKHNWETDVISFPLEENPLSGEIYIGLEVAREQAKEYNVSLTNELSRLAIHGVLHIIGYDDATDIERNNMTKLENKYLEGDTSE
ncbi:MAG: rRNA maturation RNase YbeY [Ignavibacteria bacterium]|nr:rRNA maturation RNase YbeY [Ignavibacteria bacterium]